MELIAIVGGAVIVNYLTEVSKRFNVEPRIVAILLSLVLGFAWYAYQTFVPNVYQLNIANFILGSATGSTAIYEYISRNFLKK